MCLQRARGTSSQWRLATWALMVLARAAVAQPTDGGPDLDGGVAPEVSIAGRYRLEVPRLAGAPVIDGQLDEAAWANAVIVSDFIQTEPTEGAPASQPTEVRIGYDSKSLYVAFRCHWAKPELMQARAMAHDAELEGEDHVELALDTFQDRQNAFLFLTNPLGVRVEGTIRDNGEDVRWDWDDAFWSVATSRDATGWTAEFAIPFSSLRFKDTDRPAFNVNFARFLADAHELSFWKPMPYARGVWSSRYKVANYGELTGFTEIQRASPFLARPYVYLGGISKGGAAFGPFAQGGLDVKIPITSSLIADVTINPDFADAEADEQQLNLTRFPLLLPEKREFFKEGASLFYFGDRVVDDSVATLEQFNFFQSRQIGLAKNGQTTIPVLGGARVTGKIGQLGVGLLNLTSAEVHDPVTQVDSALYNFSVLRLKYEFENSSSIGLMGLNKQGGDGTYNRGLGIDGNLVVTDFLRFGGYFAKTFSPGNEGNDLAGSLDAVLQIKYFSLHALYTDIGEQFRPELGYLTRPGIRKIEVSPIATVSPNFLSIKHANLLYDFNYVMDRNWLLQSRQHKFELLVIFNNGYAFALIPTVDRFERLVAPFPIYKGVTINEGVYVYRNLFFGFGTDLSQPVAGIIWLDGGWFYGGTRFRSRFVLFASPLPGLALQAIYDREAASLPEGSFASNLVSAVATYAFTNTLTTRLTFQYAADYSLRANLLVNWNYMPGGNLYFIVNEQRDLLGGRPWLDSFSVGLKMVFTWGPAPAPRTRSEAVALTPTDIDGRLSLDGRPGLPGAACLNPQPDDGRLARSDLTTEQVLGQCGR